MIYIAAWFYTVGALTFGGFADQGSCAVARTYHTTHWQVSAGTCFEGYLEHGLAWRSEEIDTSYTFFSDNPDWFKLDLSNVGAPLTPGEYARRHGDFSE